MPNSDLLPATVQELAMVDSVEHFVATLAGRVGNPRIAPMPPVWPLLALVLLSWSPAISAEHVMIRATEMNAKEETERGLAIVVHLFPELEGWLSGIPLKIPRWERALAVPLAARRLVLFERPD